MTRWTKRPTVANSVLNNALLGRDVTEIVRATGAKPQTVRQVLRRAFIAGEINLSRFKKGRSYRAVRIVEKVDVAVLDVEALNNLLIGWSKG